MGIIGAGVGGATLGALLKKRAPSISVRVWERSEGELPPGFNLLLAPNHLECLSTGDAALGEAVREKGVPFKMWTHRSFGGDVSMRMDASSLTLGEYGSIGRWDVVNETLRSACDVEYGVDIVGHEYISEKEILVDLGKSGKATVDLLVVADGRYSKSRGVDVEHRTSPGLSNFRLVLPRNDDAEMLLETHERIYNFPDLSLLGPGGLYESLSARSGADPDFENVCMKGHARIGIMPLRSSSKETPDSYALYGNFRVAQQIPKEAKTADGLMALYTPEDESKIDDLGRFTLDGLSSRSDEIYWARMQRSDTKYRDPGGHVMFIGDAASGFFPTLGQGAGQAIEDAVVAAGVLAGGTDHGSSGGDKKIDASVLTSLVEKIRYDRREFVADLSDDHAAHMAIGGRKALAEFDELWRSVGGQSDLRKLWTQYPRFSESYSEASKLTTLA